MDKLDPNSTRKLAASGIGTGIASGIPRLAGRDTAMDARNASIRSTTTARDASETSKARAVDAKPCASFRELGWRSTVSANAVRGHVDTVGSDFGVDPSYGGVACGVHVRPDEG